MNIKRITVLKGGWSSERSISLLSGNNVAKILRGIGFEVYEIDVKKDLKYLTEELYKSKPDFIYNALHGIGGEDGTIQGILEVFGIPYSNSGVLSSAIGFDKSICKILAKDAGINTIPGYCIRSSEIKNINKSGVKLNYPFIIKPACNGSSVGVFLISDENDLVKVQSTPWEYGDRILVERYIKGREFTVVVIDNKVKGAIEIEFQNQFYDYESKYNAGKSSHILTFQLNNTIKNKMFEMAEQIYAACLCRGIARVDFRYDGEQVYFLEINTQPGMTEKSLVPDVLRNNNIEFTSTFLFPIE